MVSFHAISAFGGGGTAACILNLYMSWRRVISSPAPAGSDCWKNFLYPLDKRVGGPFWN